MLFVGRPDDRPFSAREMAAAMRGVSPAEIDAAVAELNAAYERDAAPYEIIGSAAGFRLNLRSDLHRMRDKLHGRTREAKLTPAAVEVLSIVAYNQPTTVEAINELRGTPSGAVLQSLVRRKLVRVDRGRRTRRAAPVSRRPTASSACSASRARRPAPKRGAGKALSGSRSKIFATHYLATTYAATATSQAARRRSAASLYSAE